MRTILCSNSHLITRLNAQTCENSVNTLNVGSNLSEGVCRTILITHCGFLPFGSNCILKDT